ncbi:hypothetical protein B6U66_01700 [Candidatus Bathyarchaeota archaeon ex4484_135]|nr:MAG: hypothetical protein B6U66_01700 [Candidatus Bathyarchaeota archaeon ex4484_135]
MEWRARLYDVSVFKVSPKGVSSTCPNCSSKLRNVGNRRLKCPVCGLEEDRDLIAAINLGTPHAQATLMAPNADGNPRAMKGKLKNGGYWLSSHFSTAY